ncbi:MAG: PAS domain S-box protein, partial [Gemmatimonadota bacterium]|nr:PAS domain S-box protein [Gemmatimonadota bacterium]
MAVRCKNSGNHETNSACIEKKPGRGLEREKLLAGQVKEPKKKLRTRNRRITGLRNKLKDNARVRPAGEQALPDEIDLNACPVNSLPAFFVALGLEGNILTVNETLLLSTGFSSRELVGRDFQEAIVPKAHRGRIAWAFENVVKLRMPLALESRLLTAGGRELLVEWHFRPMFKEDGSLGSFMGFGIDITRRKRAEEELVREREKLRLSLQHERLLGRIASRLNSAYTFADILDELLDAVVRTLGLESACFFELDPDNRKALRINLCPSGQCPGDDVCRPREVSRTEAPSLFRLIEKKKIFLSSDPGIESKAEIKKLLSPALEDNTALVCPVAIAGRARGFISFSGACDYEWSKIDTGLFKTVSEMFAGAWERDFQVRARREAERKQIEAVRMAEKTSRLASLGTLAAGIAHEINQPLTALKVKVDGSLYFLDQNQEISRKQKVDILEFVSRQADRIDEIVQHMRSLTREGKGESQVPVMVNGTVRQALCLVHEQLSAHSIELETAL